MTRSMSTAPDFYEILSLPFPSTSSSLSKQQLKAAYHKALLKHHPDKASSAITKDPLRAPTLCSSGSSHTSTPTITVDEITAAYKTLSDPILRAEYDRSLRLDRSRAAGREKNGAVFHTGLEVVDLEDLVCDEGDTEDSQAVWYRGCRCGDERGFLVSEQDLEREAEHGEIVVGCRGCSLWMKVLFAVQDEEDQSGHNAGQDVGLKT